MTDEITSIGRRTRGTESSLVCLCRWLSAPTPTAAEKHFASYFNLLSPLLFGTLVRRLRCDSETANDIVQEAFIRLLSRLKSRDDAFRTIRESLNEARLPVAHPLLERLTGWRSRAETWIRDATKFCDHHCRDEGEEGCEDAAQTLNSESRRLREAGSSILLVLDGSATASTARSVVADGDHDEHDPLPDPMLELTEAEDATPNELEGAESVVTDSVGCLPYEQTAERGCAASVSRVTKLLPRLEMPLPQFLYVVAKHLLMDHYRRGKHEPWSLEQLEGEATELSSSRAESVSPDPSNDSCLFLEDVEKLLDAEVRRAEHATANARTASERKRAERRLEKQRHRRLLYGAVLEALITSDDSKTAIGRRLGLTRDQVDYLLTSMARIVAPAMGAHHDKE